MLTLTEALEQAMSQHRAGRLDVAEGMYRQITQQIPQHPDAWQLLGVVAQQRGQHTQALELFDHALSLNDQMPAYFSNRGESLRILGRLNEAEASLRRALELEPNFADAWNNLGLVLQNQGRLADTIEAFNRSLAIQPDRPEVLSNRGLMYQKSGRPDLAIVDMQRALQVRPTYAQGWNNLGGLLHEQGRFDEARQAFELALKHFPKYSEAQNNLGLLFMATGHQDKAGEYFRQVIDDHPGNYGAFSNLLLTEQYRPGVTLDRLAQVHGEYNERYALPLRAEWQAHANTPEPERALRLGFVSADMFRHPVAALVLRVFERLDRRQFQIYVYNNRFSLDEVTDQLRPSIDVWRDIAGLPDADVANSIRRDQIDVLFDLSGHTAGHRLLVFARKPAPVQVSWLGYVGTTGLTAIDYLFTDEGMIPAECDRYYAEQVVRLPRGSASYALPDPLPDVAPPPLLKRGAITYGSFNNPSKLTPQVLQTWAEILRRTPDSRLILKFRGLDDPGTGQYFRNAFTRAGIAAERIELRGPSAAAEMFAQYGDLDVALDPFPYTGGTTTMLTLAMGVPVITCPGETVASRQTYSVLRSMNFLETVTPTFDEYINLAVRLAHEPERLSLWRQQLRAQVQSSPFFDIAGWIPTFETTVRELWRRWCEQRARQ